MEPSATPSILSEVKDFLSSLRRDWPEVFAPAPRARPAPPPSPPPSAPLAPELLIPSVADDAPLKAPPAGEDLVARFRARAGYWAPLLGVSFGRVSVKDQRSLWGSCTRAGNLNFSWRLSMAPDEVLDYVVVHELAHRAQMNHSRRFWEVVERACPGHRTHRRWLRRNGRALYAAPRPS